MLIEIELINFSFCDLGDKNFPSDAADHTGHTEPMTWQIENSVSSGSCYRSVAFTAGNIIYDTMTADSYDC